MLVDCWLCKECMNSLDSRIVVRSSVAFLLCSHGHKNDVVLNFVRATHPSCSQLYEVSVDGANSAAGLAVVAAVVGGVASVGGDIVDLGVVVNAVAVVGGVGCLLLAVVVFVGGRVQSILGAPGSCQL